eukprot:13457959-Ditylum_brightwellii.AAC.1
MAARLSVLHPLLQNVLHSHQSSGDNAGGEMTLMSVSLLLVLAVASHADNNLKATLASALAVLAFRIRYQEHHHDAHDASNNTAPIISILCQSLTSLNAPSNHTNEAILLSLSSLPDALFGN